MKRLSVAALFVLSATGAAVAQDLPDRPIRRTEVIVAVKRQFARLDANHDGIVTRAEFDAYRARQAPASPDGSPFEHIGGHWFDHADPDGTGRVTVAMAARHPLELFDMADVDRDGTVSVDERRVAQAMGSLMGH